MANKKTEHLPLLLPLLPQLEQPHPMQLQPLPPNGILHRSPRYPAIATMSPSLLQLQNGLPSSSQRRQIPLHHPPLHHPLHLATPHHSQPLQSRLHSNRLHQLYLHDSLGHRHGLVFTRPLRTISLPKKILRLQKSLALLSCHVY